VCVCACVCVSVCVRVRVCVRVCQIDTHRYTERIHIVQKNAGQIVLRMGRAAEVPTRHPCVLMCKNRPKGGI